MKMAERVVTGLLAQAGVGVDGGRPWDIRVLDEGFFGRVLRDRSLGLGESYVEGWWECDRLDELFCRLVTAKLDKKARGSLSMIMDIALERLLNRQSRKRSKAVAERHYDLGNDMFLSWLDSYNQYSCGYFEGTDDLELAQEKKLGLICSKLGLDRGDKVLDIGCGWGGFSRYAAERHGCSVCGVTISQAQAAHARSVCSELGLDVEVSCRDYRALEGTFDKIVSVGMFEHVGGKNYRDFMRTAHRCLRDSGIFLLHTIGANESMVVCDAWIEKYIFPGGMVPSMTQISRAAEGLFVIEDVHNLGPHYDRTLMAWNERFQAAWPGFGQAYPSSFRRMWEYYLLSCAGAFRARAMQLWQIVLTREGRAQPPCRVC